MSSSETGMSSCMPNIFHWPKILAATWFRKSRGDTGLVNTVLFCFAGFSGGCGGKDPVWLVERQFGIHVQHVHVQVTYPPILIHVFMM